MSIDCIREKTRNMRTIHWLFAVGVLLFVSGIGFVIAAERTVRSAAQSAVAVPVAAPPP
jgi:cytochrome b subunit of formate dehydrogenase